jgi:phosphatidylglycerophosphatase A
MVRFLKESVTEGAGRRSERDGFAGFLSRSIATGLGVGYVPKAQGTFGSLWAPLICLLVPESHLILVWLFLPALFLVGVWASTRAELYWGHDPGRVVVDEVLGALVAVAFVPVSAVAVAAGFFLFRAFDIFKPPPIRYFEKLPRGWGVMADDLVAGIFANLVLRLLIVAFPGIF